MAEKQTKGLNKRFIRVTDRDGNEYVRPISALRNPEDLSDEEKARCIDAAAPRGLISPL